MCTSCSSACKQAAVHPGSAPEVRTVVNAHRRLAQKRRNCWIKSLFLFSLCTKSILVASENYGWTTDVTWTILTISLLPFWALNVVVVLMVIEGQKALGFHKKYLNLCSELEQRSYGFGTTWGWVINDRLFGWTNPLLLKCRDIVLYITSCTNKLSWMSPLANKKRSLRSQRSTVLICCIKMNIYNFF